MLNKQPFAGNAARVPAPLVVAAGCVEILAACWAGIVLADCGTAGPVGKRPKLLGVAANVIAI